MSVAYLVKPPGQNGAFARAKRDEVARGDSAALSSRRRESLSREGALRRQLDELSKLLEAGKVAAARIAGLTPREREIMQRIVAGEPNKNIAVDLGISRRTVENHRASIMKKTGSQSVPALARLAFALAWNSVLEPDLPIEIFATAAAERPQRESTWRKRS